MIVLLDMDGVLADFEGGFLKKWQEEYPGEFFVPLPDRKSFSVKGDYPDYLKDKISTLYKTAGFFAGLEPIEGALDGVNGMLRAGHTVRICTSPISAFEHCVREKYRWIEKYFGVDFTENIIVAKDKTAIKGDYLVDDRPEIKGAYVSEWKQVLFDAPYNRNIEGLPRMTWSNWKEIIV